MRALDLFAGGAGGWSLGLHRAGYTTIAACEADPWRRAAFSTNFPDAVMFSDVRTLTADAVLVRCGCLPDIIVGSPPCQDISSANTKGRGVDGERSGLFFEAIRIVGECRPAWVCLENSANLRTRGADRVLSELETIGYACWPFVVGADDAGANHRRKRAWIIAWNADEEHFSPGQPASIPEGGRRTARSLAAADAERASSDTDSDGEHGLAGYGQMGGGLDASALDAARIGRSEGRPAPVAEGRPHDTGDGRNAPDGEELPAALRDIGHAWPDWNGGLAGLAASCAAVGASRVDDGLPSRLAPGVRNKCIAAYGDAVVPQITEMIGRAILQASGVRA